LDGKYTAYQISGIVLDVATQESTRLTNSMTSRGFNSNGLIIMPSKEVMDLPWSS
jgi:hypothetical protein